MKDLRFDGLYSLEYYMDVPGNDGKVAVIKFNYCCGELYCKCCTQVL